MKADLAYLVPSSRNTEVNLTDPDPKQKLLTNYVTVEIQERDVASADPLNDLAARGFTVVPFAGATLGHVSDLAWRRSFAAAVSRTVQSLLGARQVAIQTETVTVRRGKGTGAQLPLQMTHTDFTASSAIAKFGALVRSSPEAGIVRRFAAYNAWWPATPPPHDRPLALCDATTVAPADLMPTQVVVHTPEGDPGSFGEIGLYRYNPRHRWSYYPEIGPDRLLLFAGHDSDARFASQVPHGAFVNRDCPPDAPTRTSVECRLFAYW